jgi:HSP20 family molecular chaperone IbpA
MARLARRQSPSHFPELFDWLDSPWATLLPFTSGQTFRTEEYVKDNTYIVRAELPGVDPDKDVEVTVDAGVLTIRAERHEEHEEPHRSEFRYGSLTRSVTLPANADGEKVTARYDKGILQISAPITEAKTASQRIAITKAT